MKSPNLNILWSQLIVEELIRNGIDYFCLAPGSRSGPLAVAVAENKNAQSFIHFDERGLAFHALGYTAATKKPAVVITTSGTAVANLLPAIVEASKKKLPMIVLTADRPPELRKTGANQTIDQVHIFGEHARFNFDMPCPSKKMSAQAVLTTIDQAVYRAKNPLAGPVHINCMFREPLVPTENGEDFKNYLRNISGWLKGRQPFTTYLSPQKVLSEETCKTIANKLTSAKQGVIAVGKLSSLEDQEAVGQLAKKLNWPIFADVTSGLRLGCAQPNVIPYFDQILLNENFAGQGRVDCVVHLGGRMTSKRFYQFIEKAQPQNYVMVLNHPLRNDPTHQVTARVETGIKEFCVKVGASLPAAKETRFLKDLQKQSFRVQKEIDRYLIPGTEICEPSATRIVSRLLPKNSALFLASSMPIREMDMFAGHDGASVVVGANRGASGIDGTIASAAGFAAGTKLPCTLLIGDLAFLHDLNSLAMLKTLNKPFVIVVYNNNGGAIFYFLPIAKFKNVFEKYFVAPHNLSFEHGAKMFGLNYHQPVSKKELGRVYCAAIAKRNGTIIEIKTNRESNLEYHQELQANIRKSLAKH